MSLLSRTVRRASPGRIARPGDLAVVNSIEAFTLAPGHPLRGATCMFCHQLIGSARIAVIGLAGLGGDACSCSAITSDVFLIHAAHFPVDPDEISAALRKAVSCRIYHPVHR